MQTAIQHRVLIVSSMADATRVAATLESTLGFAVTVAPTFRAALIELRNNEHGVVVVDDCMAEGNPAIAEQLWTKFGMAVPVQLNFALTSASRLAREVLAAIGRREHQQLVAMRAAASQLENDLKTTVTGLLLQSQLALAEPQLTPKLTGKLELVAELAGTLRRRLEQAQA